MKTKTGKWDEYSDLKITKDFKCRATDPVVNSPVFQPVVLLEGKLRHQAKMHTNNRRSHMNTRHKKIDVKKLLNDLSPKDENNVVRHAPRRVEDSAKKPLSVRNAPVEKIKEENTSGIFDFSENIDIDVLSSPKKNDYESESDSYDYDTVVDALRKIKAKAALNSSPNTSFDSDSSLLRKILEDPEKLSEKVKQSINYKALEKLKKSLEESEANAAASSAKHVSPPTRISSRKRVSITNTRYAADFDLQTKRVKKRVKKKNSAAFDRQFQLKTLKLLEKILLTNSDSDSDFESSIKREFKAELKADFKSDFLKRKKLEEKAKDPIDKIDNELDALALFKESWISSDDLDIPKPTVKKPTKKMILKPEVRTLSSDIKIIQPRNIKLESGLKLEEVFNESYAKPKPKAKVVKKKKRPMNTRTLNKKSKTFFENEPKRIIRKIIKTDPVEKVEKPKIIPYVPLIEVGGFDGPMIEVKDTNFVKDWHNPTRPNILGRSYNDPKLIRVGERRNSSDSDNKYHDTLFNLLKNDEEKDVKPVKKIIGRKDRLKISKDKNDARRQELRRKRAERVNPLQYENYVGENYWTNKNRRHVMRNSLSSHYPDSDTGEEDRTHEATMDLSLWDHTYAKRDEPTLNWKTQQTGSSDHTYLEVLGAKQVSSLTPSIDTSSLDYSGPNSPLPESEDTNTNFSGSISTKKPGSKTTTLADDDDDEDSYLDPIGYSGESDVDMSANVKVVPDHPRKKRQYDHFKKMQKKLMRALEKSKGKGKKEKFALVKKFFAEEVFQKKNVPLHGEEHNVKERERRRELRNLFVNLADQLLDLPDNPSKIQILQTAEDQIKQLSKVSNQLLTDLGNLKSRQMMLKKRVQLLLESWKVNRAKRNKLANF